MSSVPQVVTDPTSARRWVVDRQRAGQRVGLVPTMGALHEGHLSLVGASAAECDATAVTIFVNPTQFAPHEDFDAYPRDLNRDCELLAPLGADLVFAPAAETIYPPGFSTFVEPPQVALPWEGRHRPGHFRGVATIVLKLFHLLSANVAYFGQKDYQQTLVIKKMIADLDAPIEIRVCPTIREDDGLAMSSRNAYLSESQRRQARAIFESLKLAQRLVQGGQRSAAEISRAMQTHLQHAGFEPIDYATVVDPVTLQEHETVQLPCVALVAAHLGGTRLIDNLLIE